MEKITIQVTVNSPIEKVWKIWTSGEDIKQWNTASDDWHTTKAEINLVVGGTFSSRMEAKDGSFGFDFSGKYTDVKTHELIEYTMDDNRTCVINFENKGNETLIIQTFEAETENPIEMQKFGWQSIMNSFKKYAESK